MTWLTEYIRQLWRKFKVRSLEIELHNTTEALYYAEEKMQEPLNRRIAFLRSELTREWKLLNRGVLQ